MKKQKCILKGCERDMVVKKHGLCKAHLNRFYRTGSPGTVEIITRKKREPYRGKN